MLKNYLKIAIRNILRFRLYSFINIIGLSVGIASFILIFSYVYNEMTYDAFHRSAGNIYTIFSISKSSGNSPEVGDAVTPDPLPSVLENDFPRLIKVARLFYNELWVTHGDESFKEDVYGTDESLFDMFDFKLLEGDRRTVLNAPNSAVITEEFAKKIFGREDPIGKTLKIDNNDFAVTGVLTDFPPNSSIRFNVLVRARSKTNTSIVADINFPVDAAPWNSYGTHTFVSFTGMMTPNELTYQLPKIISKYIPEDTRIGLLKFELVPLKDLHFATNVGYNMVPPVSRTFLFLLMTIAISILLISCVNFMNISVSRHSERAREIGMRKVLGAQRSQVMRQFLSESVLMSIVSLVIGIGLAELCLNQFRDLTGNHVALYPFYTFPNFLFVLGFGILLGTLAGSYPAFFLSAYRPVDAFGKQTAPRSKTTVRNILVVAQFVIAALLMAGVLIISKQIDFMKDHGLGFQPGNVVALSMGTQEDNGQGQTVDAFVNSVNANKAAYGIMSTAVSENIPGDHFNNTFGITPAGMGNVKPIKMVVSSMDENFIPTYKIKLVEGRNFSPEYGTDKFDNVIINQSAARILGWKNAIEKGLNYNGEHHIVIGVMEDINIAPLQNAIQPMVYRYSYGSSERDFLSARVEPSHFSEALNFLRNDWNKFFPNSPFDYFFVTDKYAMSYYPEEKIETIIEVFSSLAIFLAGLGLFGLSSLKVTQRTKEIGVRKVLGATIPDILKLFTKEFLLLVMFGNLIAVPISILVLNKWLQEFAYRTNIGFGIFLITAMLTLFIAFATVSLHAIRAATANPVESLRNE
ncbi:MAG: ABC transporter permease [Candidatus Kryptoniota bacterium]